MSTLPRPSRGVSIASVSFFSLAAIALGLGTYLGLAFLNAPGALMVLRIAFGSPQFLPLIDMIDSGLQTFGVMIALGGIVISALLVAAGMSLRRTSTLAERVRRLEAALDRAGAAHDTEASYEHEHALDGEHGG